MNRFVLRTFSFVLFLSACTTNEVLKPIDEQSVEDKVNEFIEFELTTDTSVLSENQKKMLINFFLIADIMDELFWYEAYGDKDELLERIESEPAKEFVNINYGPWERLNGNQPFLVGVGLKPDGANFYPQDMSRKEFEALDNPDKNSLYTFIRRDSDNNLRVVWYHEMFEKEIEQAAALLEEAALLAEDPDFANYLNLRAQALRTDEYLESDMAWMEMKNNLVDFVVGPIENYEDGLFGIKTAHEAYILIKDKEWSERLQRYAALLPGLQQKLPVSEEYRQEVPGANSDLGAYDAVYYAGDCNAGSKTIAINLPNDERVHLEKGSRRLQLKNSMRAKFEKILVPISNQLIDPTQQQHVTFDAFFENTMFHEVAHGLGIKETVNGKGKVREALKDMSTTIEESKADILGLFMVNELQNMGEIDVDLMDNYVTFMAGIFRSIRFGTSSSHGRANLIRFNYFKEKGAFALNEDGTYRVEFEKMQEAVKSLSELILTIQGNGDYEGAVQLMEKYGVMEAGLSAALVKVNEAGIPRDIVFKQGPEVLGLQ